MFSPWMNAYSKKFFPLWISRTQQNNYSMKCTDFLSAATSYLWRQRKRRKEVAFVDCKGGWHFKGDRLSRFFSLSRGNMPDVTSGIKNEVRSRNSSITYWWEWCWHCLYLLPFLKCHISGLSYEKQPGTWVSCIFQFISSTDYCSCATHALQKKLSSQRLQKRTGWVYNHSVHNKNILNLIWLFIVYRGSRHKGYNQSYAYADTYWYIWSKGVLTCRDMRLQGVLS